MDFRASLLDSLQSYANAEGALPRAFVERLLWRFTEEEKLHGRVIQELGGEDGPIDMNRFVDWVCSPPRDQALNVSSPKDQALNMSGRGFSSSKQRFHFATSTLKKVQCFRTKEQSMLLGVSIAFLSTDFLAEVEEHFGPGADPNYHEINPVILYGPKARGFGIQCPRDKCMGTSYADALDAKHTGPANVMLSWTWNYSVQTVVTSLARWCKNSGLDPKTTYVWQCALCNNQFRIEEKRAQNEHEDFQTFRKVFESRVHSTGHILALLSPWHGPMYTTRIWCVFELWVACQSKNVKLEVILSEQAEQDFHESLSADGVVSVWKALGKVQIQKAKASVPEDRANIMRLVDPDVTEEENFSSSEKVNKLNQVVVQRLQQWCAEAAAQFAERSLEEELQVKPKACANTSWLLMEVNDWQRAMALLVQGRQALERLGKKSSLEDAWLLKCMGNWYTDLGHYKEGMDHFNWAKEAMESAGAANTVEYARLLRTIGKSLIGKGHVEAAMNMLQLSNRAFVEANATNTPNYAVCLRSIGFCFGELGDLEEAMEHYSAAKAVFEATQSAGTPTYAGLLADMGRIKLTERKLDDAMELFQQSLQTFKMAGAEKSKNFADLLHFMGDCLDEQGKSAEALRFFNEAKATFNKCHLTKTTNYAALLANMADCMENQGMQEQSADLRKEATEIYKAANVASEVLEHMSPLERRRQRIAKTPKTPMTSRLTFHIDTERTERDETAAEVSA